MLKMTCLKKMKNENENLKEKISALNKINEISTRPEKSLELVKKMKKKFYNEHTPEHNQVFR